MSELHLAQAAADLVARTCAAQEIPEHVTDLTTLRKVAALVAGLDSLETGGHADAA